MPRFGGVIPRPFIYCAAGGAVVPFVAGGAAHVVEGAWAAGYVGAIAFGTAFGHGTPRVSDSDLAAQGHQDDWLVGDQVVEGGVEQAIQVEQIAHDDVDLGVELALEEVA